jgi:hypothetical protein
LSTAGKIARQACRPARRGRRRADAGRAGGTPLFAELGATPVQFDGTVAVVEDTGVTHLRYRVKK